MNEFHNTAEKELQYATAYLKFQKRQNYTVFRASISVKVLPQKWIQSLCVVCVCLCVCVLKEFFKELAYVIVGADKSKIHQGAQQAGDSLTVH